MKSKTRNGGANHTHPGIYSRACGAAKALCLSLLFLVAASSAWSQSPIWTFGNAVINPLTAGTISTTTSCAAVGALPGFSEYFAYNGNSVYQQPSNTPVYGDPDYGVTVPFAVPGLCKQYYTLRTKMGYANYLSTYLALWDYSDPYNTGITKLSDQDLAPLVSDYGNSSTRAPYVSVIGPLRADGSRFIYGFASSQRLPYTLDIVRYHISATGVVSPMVNLGTAVVFSNNESLETRVGLQLSADGQFLFYTYQVSGTFVVSRFNLSTNTRSKVATLYNTEVVSGLEWVPGSAFSSGNPRLYYSWRSNTNNVGGIGYYDLGSVPTSGYSGQGTSVSNSWRLGFTDLERAADNSLYLAVNPNPSTLANSVTSVGSLQRLNPATGSFSTVTTTGGAGVQVCRILNLYAYIIQDQIDGEPPFSAGYTLNTPSIKLNGATPPANITVCNNSSPLLLVGTSSSYYDAYQVQVERGTLSGGTFFPNASPCSTAFITSSAVSNTFDIAANFPACVLGYSGFIRVTYTIRSACGTTASVSGVYEISQATAALDFQVVGPSSCTSYQPINTGTPNPLAQPTSNPPPCALGWLGALTCAITGATANSSSGVTSYRIDLDRMDGLGNWLSVGSTGVVPGALPANHNFNSITNGYFINNYATIKNNYVFRAMVTIVTPSCGTLVRYTFFQIIDGGPQYSAGNYFKTVSPDLAEVNEDATATTPLMHPNPATTSVALVWNNHDKTAEASVIIMDVSGKIVLAKQLSENEGFNKHTIDIGGLPAGLYQYRLVKPSGTFQGKFSRL